MIRTNTFLPLDATAGIGRHSAIPGTTSGNGVSFSSGSFIAGIFTGLALAGLAHIVNGNGEHPKHFDEPLLLPPPSTAASEHENDGAVAVPSLPHARKITDEEVELIHAWYESSVPKREIANRLCISVQTVYARIKKYRNTVKQKQDEQQ